MSYVITETCIDVKDLSCVDVCPVDCIQASDDDRMLYIDPDECIDCGACVDPCPVDAIYAEEDVSADQQPYVEINRLYFKDRAAARRRVEELGPRVGTDVAPT
jgi:NAD-dependent dihydropyrimidine dehydrogenase PreA subunit